MKIELTEEMAGAMLRGLAERAETLENDLLVVRTSEIGAQGSARAARQERDLAIKDRDEAREKAGVELAKQAARIDNLENALAQAREDAKVDGKAYQDGRLEGHADVAARLRAILDPHDEQHLTIDGLVEEVVQRTLAAQVLEKVTVAMGIEDCTSEDVAVTCAEKLRRGAGDSTTLKARCEELSGALSRAHRAMRDAAHEAKHCNMHALAGKLDEALKQAQPQKVRADLAGAPAAEAFDEAAGKPGACADAFEESLEKAFWHFNKRVGEGEDMRTVFKFVVRDLVAHPLLVRVNVSDVDQAKLVQALKEKVNAAGIDALVGVADDEIANVLESLRGGGNGFGVNLRKALAAGRAEVLEDAAQAVRNTVAAVDPTGAEPPVKLLLLRLAESLERVAGEAAGIRMAQPHPVSAP